MKKKMIVKVIIDLENKELGVVEVKTDTNIKELMHLGGSEFLSLVFKQLADRYAQKAKHNEERNAN